MRRNWSVLLGVLAFAQAAGASEYLHPNLTSKTVSLRRLALMPAHVEIAKSGVKGNEQMMKESEAVANEINAVVKKVLSNRGFTVLDDPISASDASGSSDGAEEERATITVLQTRFDSLAAQLLSKPKDVTKGRYSMGDEVAGMASETADAVVFVRGMGGVPTAGLVMLTGGIRSQLLCDVAVVDARTGDILFVARVDATPLSHNMVVAADDLEKPLTKTFAKLPVGK
jgi:hypothetical protein